MDITWQEEITLLHITQKEEGKKAVAILKKIEENIEVCCSVTMEPDEGFLLIDELKKILENIKNE